MPSAAITRPQGCEAEGSATVVATASVAGLMRVREAPSRLATQMRPSDARASVRGAAPVAISPTRALVAVSNTLTESLSAFTTHSRVLPPVRGSSSMALLARGAFAVDAPYTACVKVRVTVWLAPLRTVSVTRYRPGLA